MLDMLIDLPKKAVFAPTPPPYIYIYILYTLPFLLLYIIYIYTTSSFYCFLKTTNQVLNNACWARTGEGGRPDPHGAEAMPSTLKGPHLKNH
jgi:hypothetical protein